MKKPENRINIPSRRTFIKSTTLGLSALGLGAKRSFADVAAPLESEVIKKVWTDEARFFWPRYVGMNAVKKDHGFGMSEPVVVLETESGHTGWGFIGGWRKRFFEIKDQAVGMRVSQLFTKDQGLVDRRWHGLDFALHDLAGNLLNLPAWKLMGGDRLREIPIYSGMVYFDDLMFDSASAGIDAVLQGCKWDHNYGYRQLKVKVGRGHKWMPLKQGIQRDIDVVRAVHEAFPDCDILMDSNDGYDLSNTIRLLEGLVDIPLFWVEEPFKENLEDWRALKQWIEASGPEVRYLADAEHHPDFETIEPLEREGTLTLRLTDIASHGLSRWRQEIRGLEKQGTAASPHTWGSRLKTVYAGHFGHAYGNMPTLEGVTCLSDEIDYGFNRIVDGKFIPSDEPGFGMRLRRFS